MENSKAYGEGHNAYHDGKKLKHNPYKRFSIDWEEWKMGWYDEMTDDPYWEMIKKFKTPAQPKPNQGTLTDF